MAPPVIVVDWGTSNFRAWRIDPQSGDILDEIGEGKGMAALTPPEFPAYCAERLGAWRAGPTPPPVYMAGMVGAPQGWQTAPQIPLPVTTEDLARHVVAAEGAEDIWIVPGTRLDSSPPDIMRGEEVQIFGALSLAGVPEGLLCLPGTHSKWARVSDNTLVDYATAMTGEVYAVMLGHSILGRLAADGGDPTGPAFDLGLEQSERNGGLLHHLFTARTRSTALFGSLSETDVPAYLSGLLIGSEVLSMAERYPAGTSDLHLVAASGLRAPYERALRRAGFGCRWTGTRPASLRGMCEIIQRHAELR